MDRWPNTLQTASISSSRTFFESKTSLHGSVLDVIRSDAALTAIDILKLGKRWVLCHSSAGVNPVPFEFRQLSHAVQDSRLLGNDGGRSSTINRHEMLMGSRGEMSLVCTPPCDSSFQFFRISHSFCLTLELI